MNFANEILNQLTRTKNGPGILKIMIGARNFMRSDKDQFITFKFTVKAANKANYMKITLNAMDTYDVEFIRIWGANIKRISKHEGVYNEDLFGLFQSETKLALRM